MKRFISLALCALMLVSALESCAPAKSDSQSSSEDETAKYTAYLEEHLESTPERKPASLVIETAENSEAYGVDMTEFSDDGYLTRAEYGEVVILGKTGAGLDRAVRDYVKNGNPDDYFTVYGEGYRVKKLTIAGNDISEYAVIRDDNADECNTFASSELVSYIEKTCGAVLPEYTASEYAAASDKPQRTIKLTVDYPALGDEAFRIEIGADGNLTVAGGRYRGCMYGVYDLLEDIGWRFVADSVDIAEGNKNDIIEYLYESEHVDLTAALNRTEAPSLKNRGFGGPFIHHEDYGVKRKTNYLMENRHGGYVFFSGKMYAKGGYGMSEVANHGLMGVDYRGLYAGIDIEGTQPCYNDEDILECIEAYVRGSIDGRLALGYEIGREITAVDVAQWDGQSFCSCPDCRKVYNEEGGNCGSVLRMTNRMAALVAEEYPGVNVKMLAYAGTNTPPKKTVPLSNVEISYCIYVDGNHFACSNHCISGEECEPFSGISNVFWAENLEKWIDLCGGDKINIWYYPFTAYASVFESPIYYVLYEDIRYLVSKDISGVYVCSSTSDGLINHALSTYLCSALAWDADMTREEYSALIEEYCNIVYGDAGENIFYYIQTCEKAANMTGCWCAFSKNQLTSKVDRDYMANSFDTLWTLYREALILADTEHQAEAVERYMAGMMFICIAFTYDDRYTNGTEENRAVIAERYTEMHRIFNEYGLWIINNLIKPVYAPTELDLEQNPLEWINE